ncbi:hypothetical protein DVR12_12445 [Chitinophaga silvatica]|uniref:ZU5 domain-containing protein n=2 Tax=Chitinophaga silvatica TaxID=2282649 RepID=A0A3E1YAA3_9BACT|nr:hypothetical protein DVR12_12445 [Chitinophaga silvatica]
MLFTLVVIFFCFSCKKDSSPRDPEPEPQSTQKPKPTEHGNSTGSVISKTIGSDGGTIEDSTGSLKVVIPQGAVDGPVNFTIEPVENKFKAGFGTTFRIKPENTTFKKDVEISIKYNEDDLKGSPKSSLFLCYQDAEGYWRKAAGCIIDSANSTLRVNTKHFSDWTFAAEISSSGGDYFGTIKLKQGEEAKIEIYGIAKYDEGTLDELISPEPIDIKGKVISWSLYGSGNLTPQGDAATYKAPGNFTSSEIVTVIAGVKGGNPSKPDEVTYVIKKILLINDEYIEYRIGGVQHIASVPQMRYSGGGVLVTGTGFLMSYIGTRVGKYPFGPTAVSGHVNMFLTHSIENKSYQSEANCSGTMIYNIGSVFFTSNTGYIEGRFAGDFFKENLFGCPTGNLYGTGTFRVKVK